MKNNYDVVILGGGLAGLTLSMQLKQQNANINVLVLEKREGDAPEAAFKIGESSVELGTHYMREVLNLKDYLDAKQLPKHGLRFFLSPNNKGEINKRVELGPREFLPVPSHQLDRGIFENDLIDMTRELGNEFLLGAKVENVDLGKETHQVKYSQNGETNEIDTRWVVDATGRSSFMKRKLGFAEEKDHNVNSTWFRVDHKIDIDTWSDDEKWHSNVENGLRYLSTVHLMDKGYWVWIIPLVGDRTSVGIVADEAFHPFSTYNTQEKTLEWLAKNEPQLSKEMDGLLDKIMDFKVMKHFAYASKETYNTDRWAVVGESGLFGDPFYSPGTDFITVANTFTGDLILRDLKGEDIYFRTTFYAQLVRAVYDNWMPLYVNQYSLWGSTQIMVAKIFWDWAGYWSINTLLYVNEGLTNLDLMKEAVNGPTALMHRYGELSGQMQKLFKDWEPYDTKDFTELYFDPFDLPYLRKFQEDIVEKQVDTPELARKLYENIDTLELIAAEYFRLISNQAHGTSMDMVVDPYTMQLNPNGVLESVNSVQLKRNEDVAEQLKPLWMYEYPVEQAV
ncbi:MAG: FAD-dependent monooxygenase [Crocinitomicaceae bacterium]|nr:FAD-dependent monooxygenase [Crocinitomicaceae bacterium]